MCVCVWWGGGGGGEIIFLPRPIFNVLLLAVVLLVPPNRYSSHATQQLPSSVHPHLYSQAAHHVGAASQIWLGVK